MLITKDEIDMMPVRALSWKQPYATMMLYGKAETRIWPTEYRGLVLICSSGSAYNDLQLSTISGGIQVRRMREQLAANRYPVLNGHALAIGRLHTCRCMGAYAPKQDANDIEAIENKTYVRFFSDLWVFEFKDVRPIKPIPWKGSQKWRNITKEDKNNIFLL
jgi:hypothetical protein